MHSMSTDCIVLRCAASPPDRPPCISCILCYVLPYVLPYWLVRAMQTPTTIVVEKDLGVHAERPLLQKPLGTCITVMNCAKAIALS